MRRALLAFAAVAVFVAILLAAVYTHGSNRGWSPDLKPGAIITLEELEKLKREG